MARDQKTKSKTSQAQKNAASRQRVASVTPTPTQASDSTQTTLGTTSLTPAEPQATNSIATTDAPIAQTTSIPIDSAPVEPEIAATGTTTDVSDTANATETANISHEVISIAATQQEPTAIQQSTASDQPVVWSGLQPSWPTWPTSKPGPRSTPPAPGMRPINKIRPEQFAEVGYNQQTGEPATQNPLRSLPDERTTGPTSFDLPTAQDVLGKRKQRL